MTTIPLPPAPGWADDRQWQHDDRGIVARSNLGSVPVEGGASQLRITIEARGRVLEGAVELDVKPTIWLGSISMTPEQARDLVKLLDEAVEVTIG